VSPQSLEALERCGVTIPENKDNSTKICGKL